MPFQSEKQRRYLWANEPEIARDWTDTYGSGIAKALGGRIGFASGLSLMASLRAMSDKELTKWNNDQGGDPNAEKILKERASTRVSGKVEAAGEDFWEQFPGIRTSAEQESAMPFMKTLEYLKHTKGLDEFGAKRAFEELREADPEGFEEKYGIDSYEDIGNAIEKGYDEARLSDEEWLEQADARQLTAESPLSMIDFSYDVTAPQTTRGPMGDEMWATPNEGISSIGPHGWDYGNQWQTAQEPSAKQSWIRSLFSPQNIRQATTSFLANKAGLGIFSGLPGMALSMLGGGNRGPVINPATRQFMNQYNVGRDSQTGRMIGGPFAGRNLPGTTMFGSKTPQEMAQKWMKKYGNVQYNTERMLAIQKEARDIAAGNTNLPPGEKTFKPTKIYHAPLGARGNGNQGNQGGTDAGHAAAGGSGMHGGKHYNRGGLAGLWQR